MTPMNVAKKMMLLKLGGAGSGGAAPAITYLFRDEYPTDESAPATSPMAAEPGPGTSTLVQTDGSFAKSGGSLVFVGQTSVTEGDLQIQFGSTWARTAGRALICNLTRTSGTTLVAGVGWFLANTFTDNNRENSFVIALSTILRCSSFNSEAASTGAIADATEFALAVVLRNTGAFFFIQGGSYTDWNLLWVNDKQNTATLYAGVGIGNASGTMDNASVRDLSAPFITDTGIATLVVASPTDATEYTGDADGIIEMTITAPGTLDGSATTRCGFYYRADADLTPAWHCYVAGDGAFYLDSIASDGTRTNRITQASVITGGATRRIRVIAVGTKHSAFTAASDQYVQRGGVIDVSLNDAVTTIEPSIPATWAGANLISYPRTSTAYAVLDPN